MQAQQLSLLRTEDRIDRSVNWSDLPLDAQEELLERFAVLLVRSVRPGSGAEESTDESIENPDNSSSA